MSKRRRKRVRTRARYLPTPIAGLMGHPTVLLLNLMVRRAGDNAITDGLIPPAIVDEVTALIRPGAKSGGGEIAATQAWLRG